jgi:hypothetical protein
VGVPTPAGPVTVDFPRTYEQPKPDPLPALKAVLRSLNRTHRIHSLDDDARFLHGFVDLCTANVGDPLGRFTVFVAVGATRQSIIALGGSVQNRWGGGSDQAVAPPDNTGVLSEPEVFDALHEADDTMANTDTRSQERPRIDDERLGSYIAKMYQQWPYNRAGQARYEVLCDVNKRIKRGSGFLDGDTDVVIGSPIFIGSGLR